MPRWARVKQVVVEEDIGHRFLVHFLALLIILAQEKVLQLTRPSLVEELPGIARTVGHDPPAGTLQSICGSAHVTPGKFVSAHPEINE